MVLAIRTSFRTSGSAPGWFQASADPGLSAALQAIHEDAAHPWTVPELAAVSALSRAAFARSFQRALGQAPRRGSCSSPRLLADLEAGHYFAQYRPTAV